MSKRVVITLAALVVVLGLGLGAVLGLGSREASERQPGAEAEDTATRLDQPAETSTEEEDYADARSAELEEFLEEIETGRAEPQFTETTLSNFADQTSAEYRAARDVYELEIESLDELGP